MKSVAVYCGSSSGHDARWFAAAKGLGRLLAEEQVQLVYGGGHVGLMGAVADGCMEAGGFVVGVIPEVLRAAELAHGGLSELHVVPDMHARKALMAELADGFVALPGGYGTLEEFFEVLTWNQIGTHCKPCVLFNQDGFFDALLQFLDHIEGSGFIRAEHRAMVRVADTPLAIMEHLRRPFDFRPKFPRLGPSPTATSSAESTLPATHP